jgi:hypothetical protein
MLLTPMVGGHKKFLERVGWVELFAKLKIGFCLIKVVILQLYNQNP